MIAPATIRLDAKLGDGEAEAIGLALEIRAKTLLIDERDGTSIARRLGVTTVGMLGVLVLASAKNLLPLDQAFAALQRELLSRVVFRGPGSGGVLQDSVGEDCSFENEN